MDIKKEVLIEKKLLLENVRSAILSTIDKNNNPNVSYAPIGIDDENNFYIYISELSKHTNNLLLNSKVSLMFIEDESRSTNIFARKRLTVNVSVDLIERGTVDWYEKINNLDERFSETMKFLKDMSDFHLFQLSPIDALIVYGFGKAFHLDGENLDNIIHLNEKGHVKTLKKEEINN
tara:strand:+ start:2501 stop:3031 length:531 start_codon:yes stop_codon:yes gene_type:complete